MNTLTFNGHFYLQVRLENRSFVLIHYADRKCEKNQQKNGHCYHFNFFPISTRKVQSDLVQIYLKKKH